MMKKVYATVLITVMASFLLPAIGMALDTDVQGDVLERNCLVSSGAGNGHRNGDLDGEPDRDKTCQEA